MKTIRTIIVDDESLALDLLRAYLSRYPQVEIIAECQNGRQAIAKANELQPDLMFLDIQMPELTGFDVIKNIQADIMPLVVFVTAYDHYALEAFDVYAVDYLLKPLDQDLLERALSRCQSRLVVNGASNKSEIIEALHKISDGNTGVSSSNLHKASSVQSAELSAPQEWKKIIIKDRDAINLINQENIDWVDAAGDYMCIHTGGQTHIMRSTLKSLLDQLNPQLFQRVHRSTIVNLTRIEKIIPCTKGEYFLELDNNERIKVSRNFKNPIQKLIAKHAN